MFDTIGYNTLIEWVTVFVSGSREPGIKFGLLRGVLASVLASTKIHKYIVFKGSGID